MNPTLISSIISAVASLGSSIGNSIFSRRSALENYNIQRGDALDDRAWQVNYNSPVSQVARLKAAGLPARDIQDIPVSTADVPSIDSTSLPFAPSLGASLGDIVTAPLQHQERILAQDRTAADIANINARTADILANTKFNEETKAARIAEILARSDKSVMEIEAIRIANDNAIKSGKLTDIQISTKLLENRILSTSEPLIIERNIEELRGVKLRNDISNYELNNMLPVKLSELRQSILRSAAQEYRDAGKYELELSQMQAYLQLTLLKGDTEKLQQSLASIRSNHEELSFKFAQDTYDANIRRIMNELKVSEAEAKFIAVKQCIGIVKDIAVGVGSVAGGIGLGLGKLGAGAVSGAVQGFSSPTYTYGN